MSGIPGVTLRGMEALPVEVEVEITGGLFAVNIVGERVKGARKICSAFIGTQSQGQSLSQPCPR